MDMSIQLKSESGAICTNREFIAAIREGREPNSSVAQVLDCYRVLGELKQKTGPRLTRKMAPASSGPFLSWLIGQEAALDHSHSIVPGGFDV